MTEDRASDYEAGSPARLALNLLAHKWTLVIVVALKGGPQRFTRLRTLVPGVTSQVLRDSRRERSGGEAQTVVCRELDT